MVGFNIGKCIAIGVQWVGIVLQYNYCIVTIGDRLGRDCIAIHIVYSDMVNLAAGGVVLQYTPVYCEQGRRRKGHCIARQARHTATCAWHNVRHTATIRPLGL